MRKLVIQDAEIMRLALQDEILRSEESRYDHRLHGILMVCSEFSCYEVAEILGHSPRTIQYWVRRFEQSGFAGLQEAPRAGRTAALDPDMYQAVGEDLRRSPREFGYFQNLWNGRLLSHHLAQKYKVPLGIRQCQRLFHRLGFRLRKPRPVIANADPIAQGAYKKTPSPRKKGGPGSVV